jgi:hypothetical protein
MFVAAINAGYSETWGEDDDWRYSCQIIIVR